MTARRVRGDHTNAWQGEIAPPCTPLESRKRLSRLRRKTSIGAHPKGDDMSNPEETPNPKKKRASGSETRQRGSIISVRVSDTERAELENAAERAGLTLGSYFRQCALTAPKTRAVRRPPIEQKLLAQLLGQLGRVGGNIHQIVKGMNFGEGVMHDELRAALAAFEAASAAIMEAMGRKRS